MHILIVRKFRPFLATQKSLKFCRCFSQSSQLEESRRRCFENLDQPMSKNPNPQVYEKLWSEFWHFSRLFESSVSENKLENVSILFPPPNITGNLHLGHALTLSVQDAFARFKRMSKKCNVSFIPGYDHAGIATYLVLSKQYQLETGQKLKDTSTEEFARLFNNWGAERITEIQSQLKSIGASVDFERQYFTLDPRISSAVTEAFVKLFERGLIYRTKSLVNWSYLMQTTLSDFEITHQIIPEATHLDVPGCRTPIPFGVFHRFAYPVEGSDEKIEVATNIIESIPGDVAVAVHPSDERYRHLIGRKLRNPLSGRLMPVICDEMAIPEFGSGAVKLTPSSNLIDFKTSRKHAIEFDNYYNEDGSFMKSSLLPEYQFLAESGHHLEKRDFIVDILKYLGLYMGQVSRKNVVPRCLRSGDVIGRRLIDQWHLKVDEGFDIIMEWLDSGKVKFHPASKVNTMHLWLNNREDWCISRQIRWGHRIPAFRSPGSEEWFVSKSRAEAESHAGSIVEQDEDVLDTWFSSALLPLSAFDWPEKSPFFDRYFPLSMLETGFDILNFWVLRMMLLSAYLVQKPPFGDVHLHGMICDGNGKKMSKSKGNVIDPVDVINGATLKELIESSKKARAQGLLTDDELETATVGAKKLFPNGIKPCFADGLRLSLYQMRSQNQVIRLGVQNIEHNRHLVNKMWQSVRFIEFHREALPLDKKLFDLDLIDLNNLRPVDRWILSRIGCFIRDVHENMETFSHEKSYNAFHSLWIQSLCDIYFEVVKPNEKGARFEAQSAEVLVLAMKTILITIHPLIPFVSEELYQRLRILCGQKRENFDSIETVEYPSTSVWNQWINEKLNDEFRILLNVKSGLFDFVKRCGISGEKKSQFDVRLKLNQLVDPVNIHCIQRLTRMFQIRETEEPLENWIKFEFSGVDVLIEPREEFRNVCKKYCEEKIKSLSEKIANQKYDDQSSELVFQDNRMKLDKYMKDLAMLNRIES